MVKPRRKRQLPIRYEEEAPSTKKVSMNRDKELNPITQTSDSESFLNHTKESNQNDPAVPSNEMTQDAPIRRRIVKQRFVRNTQREAGPIYRMMSRAIGSLSTRLNNLCEEVREAKSGRLTTNEKEVVELEKTTPTQTRENVKEIVQDINNIGNIQYNQTEGEITEREYQQVIYNVRNVNIEKPKFGGEKEIQAVTFLEDLEVYLKKASRDGKELDLIQDCLIGDARDWARIYKDRWRGLDDFKVDFLAAFWGDREQNELRRAIVQGTWERGTKNISMLTHFLRLTGRAQMLHYKIPEKQLVTDLIRHYPRYIQQGWYMSKLETIIDTAEFLRNMDDINKQDTQNYNKQDTQNYNKQDTQRYTSTKEGERKKREYQQSYRNWQRPTGNYRATETSQALVNNTQREDDSTEIMLN